MEALETIKPEIITHKKGDQISFPEMNSARELFTMVSIRNQLVVIGGTASKNTIETIRLNATLTKWNQQSIPFSVVSHCAVTLDDNVIIIGGRNTGYSHLGAYAKVR